MDLHLPQNLKNAHLRDYLPHKVNEAVTGENVGTAERIVSGALGLLMLRMAMKRGALGKAILLPTAFAAFKRAATGKCEIYQAAGLSSAAEESSSAGSKVRDIPHTSAGHGSTDGRPLYV